jgi:hypothetical protein
MTGSAWVVRQGAADAGHMLAGGNRKLVGASLAYYAFDNAVLWATFRAFGSSPPLGVIVMGYLVGSLAAALPVPAGLGALEGGLIGALVLYGAPAPAAVGAVLLYRGISVGLAVALGGAAWAVKPPPGKGRSRPRRHHRTSRTAAIGHSIIGRHSRPRRAQASSARP